MQTTVTKKYLALPFAHRQHTHKGHCSRIHGHSWDFEFEFVAGSSDENRFILDFGDLKWLKQWIEENFDHTLVLSEDDPVFKGEGPRRHDLGVLTSLANIVKVPSASCEGIAAFVFKHIDSLVLLKTGNRVGLVSVTVRESPSNSATLYGRI